MDAALKAKIDGLIAQNKVLLFVKGTKAFPQCGFSQAVIGIFKEIGAPFETVNILADQDLRDGLKEYSSWPTFPQIYVAGEFIGGCDIVREMHAKGELKAVVDKATA
ncbi:MAG: Grx4 family monothiol glutaredoxin [Polyangiales bacterium]